MNSTAMQEVYIIGLGMTRFEKPGSREQFDYPDMVKESVTKSLIDCGLKYDVIQQVFVGYCYGDSTCGQRAMYQMGLTGIPIINVNNNCSTGSTALYLARKSILHGDADCVMAIGFEKMQPGSLSSVYTDRANPIDQHINAMSEHRGIQAAAMMPQVFGNAGIEHMEKYGTKQDHFAKIGFKNHKHSALNPYSQFRKIYTLDEIKKSREVYGPLTLLQCCPTSDGSACVILASAAFVKRHHLEAQAILVHSITLATDDQSLFSGSDMSLAGYDMTKRAAQMAFQEAGITPQEVQVVELHDCFSTNELITYEALGLCREGEAGAMIDKGDVTFGGKFVINPSGGLISKGHPLGATGLAQCCELSWQLRGWCGDRQVPNVRYALQHNIGLGGAAVVGIYSRAFPASVAVSKSGYNPAIECRPITQTDFESVAVAGKQQNKAKPPASNGNASTDVRIAGFESSSFFEQLQSVLSTMSSAAKSQLLKQLKGVFQFTLKNASGAIATWTLILQEETPHVQIGDSSPTPDLALIWSDSEFLSMVQGNTSAQKAFMQGSLKAKGNLGLAPKVEAVLKQLKVQARL